ncbi:TauD/TfdA family dioxygenase [Streptomyces sp. NRRL S-495]|uniref:TauD/TfdA family dioxygenase n=1 Tax=Streptomyces sp. NRRL S-495 TaxID=1609133 RepID=UPI0005F90CC3|nr:TauD/TfdA family dioxygenase [Streptomyces sp. NRRL S-495]KJY33048.1 hypothetical protein VR45_20870 [Streptomyces sp. NRRL S-495]
MRFDEAFSGWTRASFISPEAWRLPYRDDHGTLAAHALERLADGPGFAVVTGVPVSAMDSAEVRAFSESMLGHLGRPLPQGVGRETALAWLVRDEGVSAYTDDRRFHESAFTSKSRGWLHLHNDQAVQPFGHEPDYLALLAHRKARSGGETVLVDAWSVYQVLRREFPRELDRLQQPFPIDRRHVTPEGADQVVWSPVFEPGGGGLRVRCNVKRIETAFLLTGSTPPSADLAALDALQHVLDRADLRLTLMLEEGDCLLIDDRRVLHGRTGYEDHQALGRRRCLVRVMLTQHPCGGTD